MRVPPIVVNGNDQRLSGSETESLVPSVMRTRPFCLVRHAAAGWLLTALAVACAGSDPSNGGDSSATATADGPLIVYNAAAISRPMRAVLDSFRIRSGVRFEQETAASLELARKVMELGGEPDVLALADPDLFPKLLRPRFATWYALFARNRIVLAYTQRSRGAAEINESTGKETT